MSVRAAHRRPPDKKEKASAELPFEQTPHVPANSYNITHASQTTATEARQ